MLQAIPPEVLVAFITSGFGLVGVLAGYVLPNLHKQKKVVNEVREQVSNSHSTNLRDDLDRAIHGIERVLTVLDTHGQSIADLRTDLAWERRERMDLAQRVTGMKQIA